MTLRAIKLGISGPRDFQARSVNCYNECEARIFEFDCRILGLQICQIRRDRQIDWLKPSVQDSELNLKWRIRVKLPWRNFIEIHPEGVAIAGISGAI